MVDLHTHTTCSDGSCDVKHLIKTAQNCGVDVLAITDHDSVEAYNENIEFSGRLITGVELTSLYNGEIVEILGYNIDTDKMRKIIKSNIKPFIDTIIDQSRLYIAQYLSIGVKFDEDFVLTCKNTPEKIFTDRMAYSQGVYLREMRKHTENARFFTNYDEFMNISVADFTRNHAYNPKSQLYVDLSPILISAKKAVEYVRECGGTPVLAHPFVYSPTIHNAIEKIYEDLRFDGIECIYPTFTKEQTALLEDFCDKHNLLKTGGSDFHGLDVKPNNPLGFGNISNDYIKV